MAYASWSVVFGEQPSAAKWNILGTNDAAFNSGMGVQSEGLNSTVAFLARRTTDQTGVVSGTTTKVNCATETFDVGNDYDAVTNFVFTTPYNGVYHFSGNAKVDAPGVNLRNNIVINGTTSVFAEASDATVADDRSAGLSLTVNLTAGDTVNLAVVHNAGANRTILGSDTGAVWFSGFLIGRT